MIVMMGSKVGQLADAAVNVRVKLAGLWASVLFCYLYGDYFGLYIPGKLEGMLAHRGPFGPVTQESMLGVAATMAIPSIMVCLSLLLRASISRWLNIAVAVIFILFLSATLWRASWYFYIFLAAVEIVLKAMIIWVAWTWPRQPSE